MKTTNKKYYVLRDKKTGAYLNGNLASVGGSPEHTPYLLDAKLFGGVKSMYSSYKDEYDILPMIITYTLYDHEDDSEVPRVL